MSGTASVPTQFQAAVTATGLQLDNNFNTIVGYLNDPTNRVNYATDGGTTNTLVINPSPPVVGGYSAGLTITFRAAFTNNGAVVANVSGIGNASVLDQQQRQLTVSALIAGSVYQMAYNGTSAFTLLSPNSVIATLPSVTSLTTTGAAGTYTVSSGAVRVEVQLVGGGGGGAGASSPNGNGGSGGGTRFGTLFAGGGGPGLTNAVSSQPSGGAGGTATGGAINMVGNAGFYGSTNTVPAFGGYGGASVFGGAAGSALTGGPNSGAGGGGGAPDATGNGAGGGGSGGYCFQSITNPSTSYSYTVGAGGAAGTSGTTGAAGIIIIKTFFT